jgi:WD40 repeat protein
MPAVIEVPVSAKAELPSISNELQYSLRDLKENIWALSYSPDGKMLAAAGQTGTIAVWDSANGVKRCSLSAEDHSIIWTLAFFPDGRRIAASQWKAETNGPTESDAKQYSFDGGVWIWDLIAMQSGRLVHEDGHAVARMALAANTKCIATIECWATNAGKLIHRGIGLWDAETGRLRKRLLLPCESAVFSPDGKILATSGDELRLWSESGDELCTLVTGEIRWPITKLSFSPDGKWLASADNRGKISVWDIVQRKLLWSEVLGGGQSRATGLAFSPDGQTVAVCIQERPTKPGTTSADLAPPQIEFWALAGKSREIKLTAPRGFINALAWRPDGRQLASAGRDVVLLWDMRSAGFAGSPRK